ncbi:MAG: hypothetical protein MK102_00255 [Fuerstiella sp.]|nr:hypothetical protein [Fuerstiella sp.]
MSVSKRLMILPLGLLITVSGCSGNRLRHLFAPEREFMNLSELDEYNAKSETDPDQAEASDELLASLSDSPVDKSGEQDHEGFFSINRWLKPKLKDTISPDPFLDDDQIDENENNRPVVVVGHSNEVQNEQAEESASEDEQKEQQFPQHTADTATFNQRQRRPTFADIMAEFQEDDEKSDDLDALAEEWLADQNNDKTSIVDDFDPPIEFDPLIKEAIEDSTPVDGFGDSAPSLTFDVPEEQFPALDEEKPQFDLVNVVDDSPETIGNFLNNVSNHSENEQFGESQNQLTNTDVIFDDDPSIEDSLWQSSDSMGVWQDNESIIDETTTDFSFDEEVEFSGDTKINAEPVSTVSGSQLPRVTQSYDQIVSASDVTTPADVDGLPLESPKAAVAAELHLQPSDPDPFLSDFESQSSVATSAGPKTEVAATISVRTWLMLLGGVVIAYLLIAPERQNLRNRNNR